MKNTPGPWKKNRQSNVVRSARTEDFVVDLNGVIFADECLIIAAPDLLSACIDLIISTTQLPPANICGCIHVDREKFHVLMDATIKAKGEGD